MKPIRRFQIWYKQTEDWYGSGNPGMPVMVVKYQDGWIWYKTSLFSYRYCLNELSFRRIFTSTWDDNAEVIHVPSVPTSHKGPRSEPGNLDRSQYVEGCRKGTD